MTSNLARILRDYEASKEKRDKLFKMFNLTTSSYKKEISQWSGDNLTRAMLLYNFEEVDIEAYEEYQRRDWLLCSISQVENQLTSLENACRRFRDDTVEYSKNAKLRRFIDHIK